MGDVILALSSAFRSMLHPRMLTLMIWPMLIALVVWLGFAWWYWDVWAGWLTHLVDRTAAGAWLSEHGYGAVLRVSAWLLLMLVLAPIVLITAALLAAFLAMPLIVNFVAGRHYPDLERRRGGTLIGSIINALVTVLVFALLWIVTLPLWLTGILAPVVPAVLSAYLNQRLFRYDALSEHASRDEYRAILEASWGRMYVLGFLLALMYFVPLLNLLVPVLSGLAFTHFGLARLAELRAPDRVSVSPSPT